MRLEIDIGMGGLLPEDNNLFDIQKSFLLAILSNDNKIWLRKIK